MFKVVLANNNSRYELFFKLLPTDIANRWYKELLNNYRLYETLRFTDFKNNNIDLLIQNEIDIINSYFKIIFKKLPIKPTQKDYNELHKIFEDLRGNIEVGTNFYNYAPSNIKQSLERFNIYIHKAEAQLRTKGKHPTIVVTFKDRPRHLLLKEDFKHFTTKWTEGMVYINYCHVGKTILDAYKDNDVICKNIVPQTHYSADFMIKFGPSTNYWVDLTRRYLLKRYIQKNKFNFKNYSLGMIPVAQCITKYNKNILNFNRVESIKCIV